MTDTVWVVDQETMNKMTDKVWIVVDLCEHEVLTVHRTYEGAKETVVETLRALGGEAWEEYVELGEGDEFPADTFDIESRGVYE